MKKPKGLDRDDLLTIKKLTKINAIPEIPEIPTETPKRVIGQLDDENFGYDVCLVTDVCLNDGICVSHQNEFFCNCKITHYGKTCEFKADKSKCNNNFCMNNSTCYSTSTARQVPNLDILKGSNKGNATIFVNYECWCRHGFEGAFCEFSESMRHCAEDKCNHHGIVKPNLAILKNKTQINDNEFKCECHCEEFYSGNECEIISPCRDMNCVNNGTCILNNESGTAKCECPKQINFLPVEVKGEMCEIAYIPNRIITDDCVPCQNNFLNYFDCILRRSIFQSKAKLTSSDLGLWIDECKSNNSCWSQLNNKDCINNGTCQVIVSQLPLPNTHLHYNSLFVIPKCQCTDDFEGNFCEIKIKNECEDDLIYENEKIIVSKKCGNGICNFDKNDGSINCTCNLGYRGVRCNQKDPCIPNPCGDAICVEFPLSDTFSDSDLKHTCICKTSQEVDVKKHQCITEHYDECFNPDKTPRCENDGNCYPCLMDSVEQLALCNEDETQRGFRCICNFGFQPPFCRRNASACDTNRCQSGAECIPIEGSKFDYKCVCRRGFNGTFCHTYLGVCIEKGDEICLNGKCVTDETFKRRFSCDCEDGFEGFNCEQKIIKSLSYLIWIKFEWFLPFLAFLTSIVFTILLVKRKKHLKKLKLLKWKKIAEI